MEEVCPLCRARLPCGVLEAHLLDDHDQLHSPRLDRLLFNAQQRRHTGWGRGEALAEEEGDSEEPHQGSDRSADAGRECDEDFSLSETGLENQSRRDGGNMSLVSPIQSKDESERISDIEEIEQEVDLNSISIISLEGVGNTCEKHSDEAYDSTDPNGLAIETNQRNSDSSMLLPFREPSEGLNESGRDSRNVSSPSESESVGESQQSRDFAPECSEEERERSAVRLDDVPGRLTEAYQIPLPESQLPGPEDFLFAFQEDSSEEALYKARVAGLRAKPRLSGLRGPQRRERRTDAFLYPCQLCAVKTEKDAFRKHVKHHSDDDLRSVGCALCDYANQNRSLVDRHLRRVHGVASSVDSVVFRNQKNAALIRALIEKCFGDLKSFSAVRRHCRPCDKWMDFSHVRVHITSVHLKLAMHKCRLCLYEDNRYYPSMAKVHVKAQHPGEDFRSSVMFYAKDYKPRIASLILSLFDPI